MTFKKQILILAFLTVAALALHLWGLGSKPLWVDEASAWEQGLTGKTPPHEPHLPFFFRSLGFYARWAGESEFALRLPSATATALMVVAIWWAAVELGWTPGACLGAAVFAAFCPYLLLVGQQARMYGLAGLEGAVFIAAMLAWRRRMKVWPLVVAAAAAVAGVYTLHSFWFLLAGAAFLWPWRSRRSVYLTIAVYTLVVLSYLPCALMTLVQARYNDALATWGLHTALAGIKAWAGALFYMGAGFTHHPLSARTLGFFGPKQFVGLAIAAGVALAPVVVALVRGVRGDRTLWLIAAVLLVGLGVNIMAPSGAEQMAAVFPLFVLLWGGGVSRMTRAWALVFVLGWAVVAGQATGAYFKAPLYPLHPEDWRGAGKYLTTVWRAGDGVATFAGPGGSPALRYYTGLEGRDVGRSGLNLGPEALAPWLGSEADGRGRVFLLYGDWGDVRTWDAIRNMSREGYTVGTRRFGEGLVLFEIIGRRPPAPPPPSSGIPVADETPSK